MVEPISIFKKLKTQNKRIVKLYKLVSKLTDTNSNCIYYIQQEIILLFYRVNQTIKQQKLNSSKFKVFECKLTDFN